MACNIINTARIELLNKDNYDTWCLQVEALLTKNDLWDYANGNKEKPVAVLGDNVSEARAREWDSNDKKAKSDLILSISPTELKQIKGCRTSNEVWKKLHSVYASQGPAKKSALLRKLTSHRMSGGSDIREHINNFQEIIDKLAEMDIDINQGLQSAMLLNSLPTEFENFRCAIESRDELPKLDVLKVKILEEFEIRHEKDTDDHGAMAAKVSHRKYDMQRKDEKIFQRTSNREQKQQITCYNCHKVGHKANDCYSKRRNQKYKYSKSPDSYYVNFQEKEECNMIENPDKQYWCLDSGCTTHICKDPSKFLDMKPLGQRSLNLASFKSETVEAKGSVHIKTCVNKEVKDIKLEDTLYVPQLRSNLISVARIVDRGNRVIFEKTRAFVEGPDKRIKLKAIRHGNLFYIQENKRDYAKIANHVDKKVSNLKIWHERLGHLNIRDLLDVVKKGRVTGIENLEDTHMPVCEICIQGKLTNTPFPKRTYRSTKPLEIVHSDVCGPMSTESIGGSRYILSFIDDYSRWGEVYFIRGKHEVLQKFKEFKRYMEKCTGYKIKYLQTDNGREYCNKPFDQFLKTEGIYRRLTVPYTPEQNGVAERRNRTLLQTSRCMLIKAGLTVGFWAEAVATANYIRNRCPTKILNGKTPFELWNKRPPNLSHLKIFGMKTYVLNKNPNKRKFEPRTKTGIFMGYSEKSKAYRVWLPNERKVIVSRDVRVLENMDCNDNIINLKDSIESELSDEQNLFILSKANQLESVDNNNDENTEIRNGEEDGQSNPDMQNRSELQLRRGPGRPSLERTGRRGRPKKLFHYRSNNNESNTNNEINTDYEENEENQSADINNEEDENDDPDRVELEANVAEVPIKDALDGEDQLEWRRAIKNEVRNFIKNNTFDLVERPLERQVIGCRTVLTNKYNSDGTLAQRKARIVARGFAQRKGVDFFETFAPVARLESIRLLMALAIRSDMIVEQMDVTSAYLNGPLSENIFMEKPEYLKEALNDLINDVQEDKRIKKTCMSLLNQLMNNKDMVCHLNKALYGLKQAGKQWHERLSRKLKDLGLRPTVSDPCIYYSNKNESQLFVAVYVDDIVIISKNKEWISEIKRELSKEFDVKDLGRIKYCLGIEIQQTTKAITMSQKRYILDLLQRFGMESCKPVATPMDKDTNLCKAECDDDKKRPYRELVGALMYLAVATRPDISHAVSVLSQFNDCHGEPHWVAAKRVLRYLKGSINLSIVYRKSDDPAKIFVDADWGRCRVDRRSYTGFVTTLSQGPISWKSTKQKTVALSSTEAEYVALAEALKDGIYFSEFLKELGYKALSKMVIYNDNIGAQLLAKNPIIHPRTKHIDIRFHFLRDVLAKDEFTVEHLSSEYMTADILTKPLPRDKHFFCINAMGIV